MSCSYLIRFFCTLSFILLLSKLMITRVNAHGRMLDPPQRGSMWRFGFKVPPNYNDMGNYCGGIIRQWEMNKGKCGVCGDPWDAKPRDHEPGGMYATGLIGKTYVEGKVIEAQVEITANHMGYFEFRLCVNDDAMAKVKQDCFDENLLRVLNNNEEVIKKLKARKTYKDDLNQYRYFVPHKNNTIFTAQLQLPSDITCTQCILQWKYHTGNNYGKSTAGDLCLGCAEVQEEFWNCADIAIIEDTMKHVTVVDLDLNVSNETLKSAANKIHALIFIVDNFSFLLISIFSFSFLL